MRRLVFLCLLLVAPWLQAANEPYYAYTRHPTVFYKTILEGCQDLEHAYINQFWQIVSFHSLINSGKQCGFNATNISSGLTSGPISGETPILKGYCKSDESTSLTWPLGREEVAVGDSSFTAFGYSLPQAYCFQGCIGNLNASGTGQDFFGQPDTDPKYEIIFANVAYDLTGEACSTGTNEPIPDIPPPPEPDPCEADPTAEGCSGNPDPCETDPNAEGCIGNPGDGGGDPGDGGGDPGDGGGDPGDGGGDPGDGSGDGGDGEGSATGFACGEVLTCSGDAIQCAQLQFEKNTYCADVDSRNYPAQRDDIADFLDNPNYATEDDEEINLGEMFSEGTRFLPSSCPQAETVNLTLRGGRTFAFTYEPLCQFASDLSYLIVAAAAVFFALYVGRATGGE